MITNKENTMENKALQETIDNLPEELKKQIEALASSVGMDYEQMINIVRSIHPILPSKWKKTLIIHFI